MSASTQLVTFGWRYAGCSATAALYAPRCKMASFRCAALIAVCLAITASDVTWAEPAQVPQGDGALGLPPDGRAAGHRDGVDDPTAPHVTRGTTVRLGSAAGFLYNEPIDVVAIGGSLAVGQRFDRLAVEAGLDVLRLQAPDGTGRRLGVGERLGIVGRFDVLRADPERLGRNTMAAVYVEAGAAVAWNQWDALGANDERRIIPDDTKRAEGIAGFGFAIDHRMRPPRGLPHRLAWLLGWRISGSPTSADSMTECRGFACRTVTRMPEARYATRSMLFESSLAVTW